MMEKKAPMVYHDSSEHGLMVCKKMGFELEKQYEYAGGKYIVFHKRNGEAKPCNYPLLLNIMLGEYTLEPVTKMKGKFYDYGEFAGVADNIPSKIFEGMQKKVNEVFTGEYGYVPQDTFMDYICNTLEQTDYLKELPKPLYLEHVREALNSTTMEVESEKDLYFICVQYAWMGVFERLFKDTVYNSFVNRLNEEGKTIFVDDLERIANGVNIGRSFDNAYAQALEEIDKLAIKAA